MYELWLAANIGWEIALTVLPLLLAAAAVWALITLLALRRPGAAWRARLPAALGVAVLAAVAGFLWVPGSIGSALGELRYWVDWANLAAIAAGIGAVAAAFAWPLLTLAGGGVRAR
jgi:hypothetical protein